MKSYFLGLLLVVIVYATSAELTKEDVIASANGCKDEVGATDEDVEAMFKHEPAGSSEAKCLRACVMKKFEIMNADGKLDKEAALKMLKHMAKGDADKEAVGTEIVDICMGIEVDDDHCEAAEQYGHCIKEHAEKKGLVPDDA